MEYDRMQWKRFEQHMFEHAYHKYERLKPCMKIDIDVFIRSPLQDKMPEWLTFDGDVFNWYDAQTICIQFQKRWVVDEGPATPFQSPR